MKDKYLAEHSAFSENGMAPRTEARWKALRAEIVDRGQVTKDTAMHILTADLAESSANRLLMVAVHDGHLEQVKSRFNRTWYRLPVTPDRYLDLGL